MSLSKHYKNTSAFKAEDLVKNSNRTPPVWTPDPKKSQPPFQSQLLSPNEKNPKTTDKLLSTSPLDSIHGSDGKKAGETVGSALATFEESSHSTLEEKTIDLNHYILRSEAEAMAGNAYRQGLAEGQDKAEQEFGATARTLILTCQQLDSIRSTIIGNSGKELLDFALALAQRIVRHSVKEQDHTIVATIEEALRRAVKSDEFTIHIHPDDYDILVVKAEEIVAGLSGLNNIVLRKDQNIERGGARIESDNCTLDATIAGQFEVIREEIKNFNP